MNVVSAFFSFVRELALRRAEVYIDEWISYRIRRLWAEDIIEIAAKKPVATCIKCGKGLGVQPGIQGSGFTSGKCVYCYNNHEIPARFVVKEITPVAIVSEANERSPAAVAIAS